MVGLLDDAYLVHEFVGSLRRMYPLTEAPVEYAAQDAGTSEVVAAVLPEGVAESLRRTCESTIQVAQALVPSGQRIDGAGVPSEPQLRVAEAVGTASAEPIPSA